VTDSIVSIRIPKSIVLELKERVDLGRFKDISELVRAIVRKRFVAPLEKKEFGTIGRDQLVEELERLLEMLKK
jgi:Arc/MetJ-type ribon-helix-helix transcriptional regulator